MAEGEVVTKRDESQMSPKPTKPKQIQIRLLGTSTLLVGMMISLKGPTEFKEIY